MSLHICLKNLKQSRNSGIREYAFHRDYFRIPNGHYFGGDREGVMFFKKVETFKIMKNYVILPEYENYVILPEYEIHKFRQFCHTTELTR